MVLSDLLWLTIAGIILSGGPYSVYEKGTNKPLITGNISKSEQDAPHVDWTQLSGLGIPILGICYGSVFCFPSYVLYPNVMQGSRRLRGTLTAVTCSLAKRENTGMPESRSRSIRVKQSM